MRHRSRAIQFFLVVFLAICVLWIRSYRRADLIAFFTPSGRIQAAASINGSLVLVGTSIVVNPEYPLSLQWESTDPAFATREASKFIGPDSVNHALSGFAILSGSPPLVGEPEGRWVAVRTPYWLPVILCVVATIRFGWRQWVHQQRRKSGLCVHCGYDLRTTPDRCPECGKTQLKKETIAT
jgi:hypothetical protein